MSWKLPIKMDCNFCDNLELATHPDKIVEMIKSNIDGDYATVMAASLGLVDMILDLSKKSTIITTGSPFLGSLIINAGKAYDDIERLNGKISNKTLLALMGDLVGLSSAVPVPQLKALGILGGFSLGIASLLASDTDTDLFDGVYDLLKPFFDDMNDMVNNDEELKKTFDCPFIAIPNKTVFENDGVAEITIFLPNPIDRDLKLILSTMDGSATNGSDFIAQEKEIIIPAGSNSYTHTIQIIRDGNYEGREDFGVKVTMDKQTAQEFGLDSFHTAYATLIDFPNETCPKPVTPNFSLNFPLPSVPSVYYPVYVGSGSGSSLIYGGSGGSVGSGSHVTYTPQPDIPYIPCPPYIHEQNSALTIKLNNVNSDNSNNEANLRNSNSKLLQVSNEILATANEANSQEASNLNNTSISQNKLYFDFNSDGFKERMLSWFNKDEAILVNDINANAVVDNGREILGNNYINKFGNKAVDILSLLEEFDTNNDGIIDNQDNHNLAIWIDKNQNGISEQNEIIRLNDTNSPIKSISLSKLDKLLSGYDRNGDLRINTNDSIYKYIYMQENTDNSINLYIYGSDEARAFLGDKTGNFTIQTNLGAKRVKKVVFYTQVPEFVNNLDIKPQENFIGAEYGENKYIFDMVNKNDIILADSSVEIVEFASGIRQSDLVFKVSNQGSELQISLKNRPNNVITIRSDKVGKFVFDDNSEIDLADIKILEINGNNGDNLWLANAQMPPHDIHGTDRNDSICGNLYTKSITGGAGDDMIYGAWTDTVYYFKKGDGKDWIQDAGGRKDVIKFVDFNYEDVEFTQSGNNLIISSKISNDKITIDQAYNTNNLGWRIEIFEFKDKIFNFTTGELLDNNTEFIKPIVSLNDGIYFYDDTQKTKYIIQENFDNKNINPYSLQANGISQIIMQSGYVGNGAKIGVNNGEFTFDYKWFESDNLDTVYEKDGEWLNSLSGVVRDLDSVANDNADLKQEIKMLKENLVDKAFDDLLVDMDSVLANWILNEPFAATNSSNLYNSKMNLRSFALKKTIEISSNTLSIDDEKKIAVVEAYRGARLTNMQKQNPYIIAGILKEYDNIKFDTMKKMLVEKLGLNVSSCSQMFSTLNLKLAKIANGTATPQETALSINLLAVSLQRDFNYAIFQLTKVNQNGAYLTNPIIMNLLSKTGINFSLKNNEISGVIGKHNFGGNESESFDFSGSRLGITIEAKGGNDFIIGSEFNDELNGGNGNDIIFSGKGIDIVSGGAGNDLIMGSDNSTIYEYYLGDGDDVIYDEGGIDILRFGFLKFDDVNLIKNGDDMIINISNHYARDEKIGSITIKNGFTSGKIEQYYFENEIFNFDEFIKIKNLTDEIPSDNDNPQEPQNNPVRFEKSLYEIELNDIRMLNSSVVAIDTDKDELFYEIIENAKNGKFTINSDGSYTYEANSKFIGSDSVKIRVSDVNGSFDEADIAFEISVSSPVIESEIFEFDEDTNLNELISVKNPIGGELLYEIVSNSSNLISEIDTNGNLSLTPNADFNGIDIISVKVTNEYALSTTKEINLIINPVNDAPMLEIKNETIELRNIFEYSGNIGAKDIDGDTLNYKVLNPSSNFVLNQNGDYTYKSLSDNEKFEIEISDNNGGVILKSIIFKNLGYVNNGYENIIISGNESENLKFENLNLNDIKFSLNGDDLVISSQNSSTTIKDYLIQKDMKLNSIMVGGDTINISNLVTAEKKWWQLRRKVTLNQSGTIVSIHSDEKLNGSNQNDTIISTSGGNKIYGNAGDDMIFATADDIADGGNGDDKLIANGDNITLIGGNGNDIYEVSANSNNITIKDKEFVNLINGGSDILRLNGDLDKGDITFFKSGLFNKDLIIRYGDKMTTILNQSNSKSAIEKVELSNGEFITSAQIDKIIEQLNAYADDNGLTSITHDDISNNQNLMQIVMSGWNA